MGKPYQFELRKLPDIYRWAVSLDIKALVKAIKTSAHLPLIAVGSGGSLSVAEIMIFCQQYFWGCFARSVTPLELLTALPSNGKISVWLFSASGRNIDIQRAFKHALLFEPKHIAAIVGRLGSPLAKLSNNHQYADFFEYALPTKRDGFLATNSLLAFSILICRSFIEASQASDNFPVTLTTLLRKSLPKRFSLDKIGETSQQLWERNTLHVLFSNELKTAAIDIESKFIEAGLCSIHLADFRNFSHGRHHWFDKHSNTSAILVLSVTSDKELANKTLELIPKTIPRLHIPIQTVGIEAIITGLVLSMYLAGYAGRAKGIDPGRPGVPAYGSKIYNLRTDSGFSRSVNHVDICIKRKVGTMPANLSPKRRALWRNAYYSFKNRLLKARFQGLVLDYDGTVVDNRNRFDPPTAEISEQIIRLLKNGITIGFATGRGKSIREDLKRVIPNKYWGKVILGYYNGAEIAPLRDDNAPDGTSPPCADLQILFQSLKNDIEIMSLANFSPRKFQLTIEPKGILFENFLWEFVQSELCFENNMSIGIYRSGHSIDILAQGVSKISVLNEVVKIIGGDADVLALGDRGKWPGNDSFLLKHVYSLSVDEVSLSKDTCWNLCPAGVRGLQGTVNYLKKLEAISTLPFNAVKFKSFGV